MSAGKTTAPLTAINETSEKPELTINTLSTQGDSENINSGIEASDESPNLRSRFQRAPVPPLREAPVETEDDDDALFGTHIRQAVKTIRDWVEER